MRTRFAALALIASLAATVAQAAAARTGFQLQVDGALANPTGALGSADGNNISNLLGRGGGFALTGSVGLRRHWFAALRTGWFRCSDKETALQFTDTRPLPGQTRAWGTGPFEQKRGLEAVPVLALLQLRMGGAGRRPGFWFEAGGGMLSTNEKMKLLDTYGEMLEITGYQRDPAWTLGGGLSGPIPGNCELVGGVHWDGAFAGDGANWQSGDKPRFVNATVGVRYPRVTH